MSDRRNFAYMEHNNITAAPVVRITPGLYEAWHRSNHGTVSDFVIFLMTPSVDRDIFLSKLPGEMAVVGSVVQVIY